MEIQFVGECLYPVFCCSSGMWSCWAVFAIHVVLSRPVLGWAVLRCSVWCQDDGENVLITVVAWISCPRLWYFIYDPGAGVMFFGDIGQDGCRLGSIAMPGEAEMSGMVGLPWV